MKTQENATARTALKTAALILGSAFLGLLTVQGTHATWNAMASTTPQAIQSASLQVSVTANGETVRISEGSHRVALPTAIGMLPGTSKTIPLRVTNTSNASGQFTIAVTAGEPRLEGALASHAAVSLRPAHNGSCDAPATGALLLSQGSAGTLCLTTTLASDAPASLSGKTAELTLLLTARQQ